MPSETTPTTIDSTEANVVSEEDNVPSLYSPPAPPTNNDITDVSGDVAVNDNNAINTGDHRHDKNDSDIVTAPPITSLTTPPGDITDSDDEIMETTPLMKDKTSDCVTVEGQQQQVDDGGWVMVDRPSVTSDDQSLESMDSLTEECVEPIGSCDPTSSSVGAQEEVVTGNDQLTSVGHSVVTTTPAVVTSSSLPLDTASQDGGGSVADDEAEEDEMDDWWRSKGPTTTKPSTTATSSSSQPKWNSLKFTKQLNSRWSMASSSNLVTMATAKEPQPTTLTPTKSSDVLAWFSEEEEKKELVLPTAQEIAETKQREEEIAAAAAAKREKLLARKEEATAATAAAVKKDSETELSEKDSLSLDQGQQQDQPTPAANGLFIIILM